MSFSVDKVLSKMINYFGSDVRRINHALKVYTITANIARLEGVSGEALAILETAAVLHDIGIKESEKKYNSSAGNYQEIEGPPVAKELLKEFSLDENFIERVCFLIGNHHSYKKIDGLDFQVLVEADFIVNIFEDGMNNELIKTIREKYFKTKTGLEYIDSMYPSI